MSILIKSRGRLLSLVLLGGFLSACAGQQGPGPLYYWGDYQQQTYNWLMQKTSPQQQITELEKGIQIAQGKNMLLPPGYYAQLGLLWALEGRSDKAVANFEMEKSLFPEGAAYMDLLLKSAHTVSTGAPQIPENLNTPSTQKKPVDGAQPVASTNAQVLPPSAEDKTSTSKAKG